MTPETYNQLMDEAIALKVQLDALPEGSGLRTTVLGQLAENVLVVRLTAVHAHLETCPAPHERCGWNITPYPFDVRFEEAWTNPTRVAFTNTIKAQLLSGEVQPAVVIPPEPVPPRTTPIFQ